MEHIWIRLLICAALAVAAYLLWMNGWLTASRKRAAVFVLSRKKNGCKVRFSACTGTVKRVVRLRKDRGYTFVWDGEVKAGAVTAEIQDRGHAPVLYLRQTAPEGAVRTDGSGRLYLVLHFEKADGTVTLTWK